MRVGRVEEVLFEDVKSEVRLIKWKKQSFSSQVGPHKPTLLVFSDVDASHESGRHPLCPPLHSTESSHDCHRPCLLRTPCSLQICQVYTG